MNRYFVVLVLLFSLSTVSASDVRIYGLVQGLEKLSSTEKVDSLILLAKLHLADSPEKALTYCEQA